MHIALTGNLGSGKSTVCRYLSEKYGFTIYSTGYIQRELARQHNLSTLEMNQLMGQDDKYDRMIDDAVAKMDEERQDEDIIFDSRLAWHFAQHSFKVFLKVDIDVAAKRVYADDRGAEERYASLEEARALLIERARTERERYKEIYGVDYFDWSNYDLVLDSTHSSPEEVAETIYGAARKAAEASGTGGLTE